MPEHRAFAQGTAQASSPGNAYVDWICADGLMRRFRGQAEPSLKFYELVPCGPSTPQANACWEFGTVEGPPGAKAAWFAQAEDALRTQFPQIRAVVYFESNHENFGRYFDWRATSSRSSLAAFRARSLSIPTSVPPPAPGPPARATVSVRTQMTAGSSPATHDDAEPRSIDLREGWQIICRRWGLILAVTLIGAVAAGYLVASGPK